MLSLGLVSLSQSPELLARVEAAVASQRAAVDLEPQSAAAYRALAEAYAHLPKENLQQFQKSPYTAKLPGGESLRDVVSRLEPFVVDKIERERSPVVIVSHLSTLQVIYQYFVGASSNLPFWKLNIPRGSVIQLVPHLFGFEERRFSFRPEDVAKQNASAEHGQAQPATVHMASHWGA